MNTDYVVRLPEGAALFGDEDEGSIHTSRVGDKIVRFKAGAGATYRVRAG